MRERVRRARYPRDTDISFGDPIEVFGIDSLFENYRADRQIYYCRPETVIGKLRVGENDMALTAPTMYRVVRLVQFDEHNLETGRVRYAILRDMYPNPRISWDFLPIQKIEKDWPEGVEFPQGSLEAEITRSQSRALAFNIEDLWRERGGDPHHKFPKTGGLKFKRR